MSKYCEALRTLPFDTRTWKHLGKSENNHVIEVPSTRTIRQTHCKWEGLSMFFTSDVVRPKPSVRNQLHNTLRWKPSPTRNQICTMKKTRKPWTRQPKGITSYLRLFKKRYIKLLAATSRQRLVGTNWKHVWNLLSVMQESYIFALYAKPTTTTCPAKCRLRQLAIMLRLTRWRA